MNRFEMPEATSEPRRNGYLVLEFGYLVWYFWYEDKWTAGAYWHQNQLPVSKADKRGNFIPLPPTFFILPKSDKYGFGVLYGADLHHSGGRGR